MKQTKMNTIQNHIAGVIGITHFSENHVTLLTFTGHYNLTMSGSHLYCAVDIPELSVLFKTTFVLLHMPECFGEYGDITRVKLSITTEEE